MAVPRILVVAALACCASGQESGPRFRAEDVRPQGAAEVHPLSPGLAAWIFGQNLGGAMGCVAQTLMAPYETELCGTRVLVGGIEARLLFVSPGQINLILPNHPWENELVSVQVVVREGLASPVVQVPFGINQPMLSLALPAYTGMPVWIRVEKPWGKGWLRYPSFPEPWEVGPGQFDVRFRGQELGMLATLPHPPLPMNGMMGLPGPMPEKYLHRAPLHLVYPFDRPGTYQIRYTEYRQHPGTVGDTVYQQSDWTDIDVLPSTSEQRRRWFQALAASPPQDTVELLANFLPSLLAARHEAALRVLAQYFESKDALVRLYASYALNYFDAALRRRVVPGRQPTQFVTR